ncbi:MAG: endonuclease/exonuclease/phosphatase family protein [Chitinophagaceae bacterium]|nr:endonuclease/exonuclease/phosphatase family protein [Chitinophagaceae bacterium]
MARTFFGRAVKTLLISINILISILFLVACLTPYVNPKNWWITGFAGLAVPYLILVLVFFIIIWLTVRPVWALLPLVTLLVGWQQLSVVFAWHPGAGFSKRKPENSLRLIDWNVQSFNGLSKAKDARKLAPTELAATVLRHQPDIVCMQEFNTATAADNISLFSKQYPYYFFSRDYQRDGGNYLSGCIIFSRYPIVDSGRIAYPVAESLIYVDLKKGDDTIRVFTTHLQSFKFKPEDYDDMEKVRDQEKGNLEASKSLVKKMKLAFIRRGIQADMVRTEIDKSRHPVIISGDFNDVPNSYAYFRIKGNMQDAFLKKGFAIGRSFLSLAPTLRIDYILADPRFDIRQVDLVDENLSDHLMLVSDILLKK